MGSDEETLKKTWEHRCLVEEWQYRTNSYVELLKYFSFAIAAILAFPYLSALSGGVFSPLVKMAASLLGLAMSFMGYYVLLKEAEKISVSASAARSILVENLKEETLNIYSIGEKKIEVWPFGMWRRHTSSRSISFFFFSITFVLSVISLINAAASFLSTTS